jgi:malonyl-CoA/methylmalonyl-CoA synthetase
MIHATRLPFAQGLPMTAQKHLPMIERAIAHGDSPAIRWGTADHTYADLATRSHAVATVVLDGRGDLAEERLAILTPSAADFVAAQWGAWRAGGIAVPLSLAATDKELDYALADSGASCVVTTSQLAATHSRILSDRGVRTVVLEHVEEMRQPSLLSSALPDVASERRAMILYTSGTTGKPKGVVTTHACIQAQVESLVSAWRWRGDDRIPLFLPLHHIHGIINVLSCGLWVGARIDGLGRFAIEEVFGRVAAGSYTLFMAVPTIYVKLIEAIHALPVPQREAVVAGFRGMRLMVSGSAALPASVHEQWEALTGQRLLERYGMTEIGMALSNSLDGERRPGAVGMPLPGVSVGLWSEQGEPVVGEGVPGEIRVRGPNVFLEYWRRPEATRESFADGWFRTGDTAVVENGYYRILGRTSVDIIKSGGYKLSALEIEAALLEHPAIAECAVVGVPDATWGEAVAVAVVPRDGRGIDLPELREWCRDRLSPYKIPRLLLPVAGLPRNAMGKCNKAGVVSMFQDGSVESSL